MKRILVSLTALLFGLCMIGLAQSDEQTEAFIEQVIQDNWQGSLDKDDVSGIPNSLEGYIDNAIDLYNNRGFGNTAYLYQFNSGNVSHVIQIGSGNFHYGAQDGIGNIMNASLFGNNNMSIMLQRGSGNAANLSFDGDWLGGIIVQDGNNNVFDQSISGVSNKLFKVIQTNDGNILNLIDNTGFALPMEIRQTGGARLMLINGPIPIR
jgi:hypothetical protein